MKKIVLAILSGASLGGVPPAMSADQTVSMNVEKMTCAVCPLTVRKAMERVDGVQHVDVDYDTKTATVTFDDTKTTAAEVARASTEVGYPATPVSD
jgi:mercuric ion binding protein